MCFRILGFPEGALFHKGLSWISLCNSKLRSRHSAWGETEVRQLQEEKQGELTKDLLGVGFGVQGPGIAVQGRIMVWGLRAGKA